MTIYSKRFVTPESTLEQSMYLIEKVYYEEWYDNLTIVSYFMPEDVMEQIACVYPETIIMMENGH